MYQPRISLLVGMGSVAVDSHQVTVPSRTRSLSVMFLRKSFLAVAIASLGVVAAPAQSKADTTIQIIEGTITTSGGVATFTPSGAPGSTAMVDLGTVAPPGASISPALTTNNFSVLGTIGLNIVGNSISLSTALTLSSSATGTAG